MYSRPMAFLPLLLGKEAGQRLTSGKRILANTGADKYRSLWEWQVSWNDPQVRKGLSDYAR